jgi:hypothetical protein
MVARTVKLKPEKEELPAPAVRISRAEDGIGFLVGMVDKSGTEDFRSLHEYEDYDAALKEAGQRAHTLRLPVRNETGVVEPEAAPPPTEAKAHSPAPQSPPQRPKPDRSSDDFHKSSDHSVTNPFRWDAERAKSEMLRDIAESEFDEILQSCGVEVLREILVSAVAGLIRDGDLIRRLGMTIEAMAQQGLLIEKLAAKVRSLRPMEYKGVFKPGETYVPGNFISAGGSLWHCNTPTDERPGSGGEAWTLAVKRGRDGKDLRQ